MVFDDFRESVADARFLARGTRAFHCPADLQQGSARKPNVSLIIPVVARHNAVHELVEQRHREGGVTVTWTPDHSFGD